jgi:membrane-associated phospholipid phosphatase
MARVRGGLLAAALTAIVALAAEPAHAEEKESPPSLIWRGTRVSQVEVGAAGVLVAGWLAAVYTTKDGEAHWRGGILVDDFAVNTLRAETPEGRKRAARASDFLAAGTVAFSTSDLAVAAVRNPDVAWQLSVIHTEAHAINGMVTTMIKFLTRRERPFVTHECTTVSGDPSCVNSQSFLSGHASTAFTSAGLLCGDHLSIGVYGNKIADGSACIVGLLAASTVGTLRVVADAHYASDVFAGALLGFTSGYLLPHAMHYHDRRPVAEEPKFRAIAMAAPVPLPEGGAMLSITGIVL